jgi:hypothetical protein
MGWDVVWFCFRLPHSLYLFTHACYAQRYCTIPNATIITITSLSCDAVFQSVHRTGNRFTDFKNDVDASTMDRIKARYNRMKTIEGQIDQNKASTADNDAHQTERRVDELSFDPSDGLSNSRSMSLSMSDSMSFSMSPTMSPTISTTISPSYVLGLQDAIDSIQALKPLKTVPSASPLESPSASPPENPSFNPGDTPPNPDNAPPTVPSMSQSTRPSEKLLFVPSVVLFFWYFLWTV